MTYLEFKEKYSNRIRNDVRIEELKKKISINKACLEILKSEDIVKEYLKLLNEISEFDDEIEEEKLKKDEDIYKEYYRIYNCHHLFLNYGIHDEKYCLRCGNYEYDIIDVNALFRKNEDINANIIHIEEFNNAVPTGMLRDISKEILENNPDINNEELIKCIFDKYKEIKNKSDERYYSNHKIKKFVRNIKKQLKK